MFALVSTTPFPDRRLVAKRYRHDCGLEVISLEADDPENLFVVCFPTVPEDDTGAAHIVEHSVLEGSRRFPVKDPFVCLLKSSVATFLNACTYSDRTLYPFTTCCRQDYFNLLEVYWDAVFHPLLTPELFRREGWHYEIHGKGDRQTLTINGIVHNEMSGYYSNPLTPMARLTQEALFPDTPYRYDSGGVPEKIPTLTYKAFKEFHSTHYNPSVAKVLLYGNIPTEEKLEVLERHLQEDLARGARPAKASTVNSAPAVPAPDAPAVKRAGFIPDPETARTGRGIAAVSWRLDESRDPRLDIAFQVLEVVLLGNSGAPLSKALIESNVGLAPIGGGYDNETKYTSFTIGMRGVAPKDFHRVEEVAMETLRGCVKNGLPKEYVKGALARFQTLNQSIGKDYIYDMVEDIMGAWVYSDDPYSLLRQSTEIPRMKEMLDENPRMLEELIQKWLIDNPRRVRIEMVPDATLKQHEDEALARKLARRLGNWSPRTRERVRLLQRQLQESAEREDSPEALATIPVLHRNDLPEKATPIPYTDGRFPNGLRYRRSNGLTDGISRIEITLDASSVPLKALRALPYFIGFLGTLGVEGRTYDLVASDWATIGADFSVSLDTGTPLDSKNPSSLSLVIKLSALDRHFSEAVDLLARQLTKIVFSERKKMDDVLKAMDAKGAAALHTRANKNIATAHAACFMTPESICACLMHGLPGYEMTHQLAGLGVNGMDSLAEELALLARWFLEIPAVAAGAVTGDDEAWKAMERLAGLWKAADAPMDADPLFLQIPGEFHTAFDRFPRSERREYLRVDTLVHTNVRAYRAPHRAEADSKPFAVAASILTSGYLWDAIRVKGGAYGGGVQYKSDRSLAFLYSHDDPHCKKTFNAFDEIGEYLDKHPFTQGEVNRTVLQTLGPFLTPLRPDSAAASCRASLFANGGNERMQKNFEEFQAVTLKQVQKAAEILLSREYNEFAIGPAPAPTGMNLLEL